MNKIVFILCCSFLVSCNEEIKTNIIQGSLSESCGGESIADTEIILLKSDNQKVIAASETDENGNFSINYELEEDIKGTAVLKYHNGAIFEQVMTGLPLNQSLDLLAKKSSTSTLIVEVETNGNFDLDTLLYSINGSEEIHQFVSPKSGDSQQLTIPLPNSYENTSTKILYWGIGMQDYQKAKNSLNTSNPYHQMNFMAGTCAISNLSIQI